MQVLDIESSYFRPYVDMFEIREEFRVIKYPLNTASVSVVGGSSVFLFGSFLLKYLASFYVLV